MTQPQPLLPQITAIMPSRAPITGQYVQLRPLQPSDAESLYPLLGGTSPSSLWDFMPDGPYPDPEPFIQSIAHKATSTDPLFFTVIDQATSRPVGHVSFLRIDLPNRTIELGHIMYTPTVQRSRITTETIYLMMRLVFEDLGFRRCEWKCNDLNAPSKKAARRFGFTFEGLFRQHLIVKGKNRDTAWFSVLDGEWEAVKRGFTAWLSQENFDGEGRQRRRLEECRLEQ